MAIEIIERDKLELDIDFGEAPPSLIPYEDFGKEHFISLNEFAHSLAYKLNRIPAKSLLSAIDQIAGWLIVAFHEAGNQDFPAFKIDYGITTEVFLHKDAWTAAIDQIKDNQPTDGGTYQGKLETLNVIQDALEHTEFVSRNHLFDAGARPIDLPSMRQMEGKVHSMLAQTYEQDFRIKAQIVYRQNERYRAFLPVPG